MKKNHIIILPLLIFFAVIAWFMLQQKNLVVVTMGPVPIYDSVENAMKEEPRKYILMMSEGQTLRVIDCIDVKHYQLYRVEIPDGSTGIVSEGDYKLLRNGKPSSC